MKTFRELFEIKLGNKKVGGPLDAFMDDIHATTDDHPFARSERVYGGEATFDVHPFDKHIHISDIRSLAPRSGAGTRALNHLKSLADKHGVELRGQAKVYHHDKNYINDHSKLRDWYTKNGFKAGRGDKYDGYPISYKPGQNDA